MVVIDEPQAIEGMSPGQMLVAGRQRAGLTQEQVAKNLYMTIYKVNALEVDDYSRLNSETFARGYIRAYANLVKLNVEEVLAAYDLLLDQIKPQVEPVKNITTTTQSTPKVAWIFLLIVALFFLVLWLISVWFFDNHGETTYTIAAAQVNNASSIGGHSSSLSSAVEFTNETVLAKVAVTENIQVVTSTSSERSVKSVAVSSGQSKSTETMHSSSVMSLAASSAGVSNAKAKNAPLDEISFDFKAESWLEVSDARGDVLATELQPQGSKLKLLGRAPFDVKLGNAPSVDVLLNGKKIEVIPLMGSNVLIMKVGN